VRKEIIPKEAARSAKTRIATMVAKTNVSVINAQFVAHALNLPESERSQIDDPKLFPGFMESVKRNLTLAEAGYAAGIDREPTLSIELRVLTEEFIADAERDQMKRGIVITEWELNDYYREHKVDFETATTRQVWIHLQGSPWGPGRPKWPEAEARLKAERLHQGLLAGGSFEKLAAAEGIDEVFDYTVTRDLGFEELKNATFATSAGSVAPLVRTDAGHHVIRVDSRTIPPFDTVKLKIDELLRAKRLRTLLDALVASAELQYDRVYFASR
jgi:PPIC-type PPIASE domain